MPTSEPTNEHAGDGWLKAAALVLVVAALGLPINALPDYALLVVLAVIVFAGTVDRRTRAWLAAVALVAAAVLGQWLLSPPRIEEGHNVFLPGPALERALPPPVYRAMAEQFDALYPPDKRCDANTFGCWRNNPLPDGAYGFSADGVWHRSDASRAVTTLDFSDPVWLRLGFVNEVRYNWTAGTDVKRAERDKRFWMGLKRWQITMPWYEMIRLPAAFVGGEVCWRGDLMWEGDGERFSRWRGESCRNVEPADVGRRIFGLAIVPDSLAMRVVAPWSVQLRLYASWALAFAAAIGVVALLVRFKARATFVPFLIVGLAVLVIAIDDASFLGALRPLDGGDDGLFYDGVARILLQRLLAGDVVGFLQGTENVYYYGGPGLRYFLALQHIVFGETYLGYLSLVLAFPFFVRALFGRFLPAPWPLALTLLFLVPIGTIFGTTFVQYSKWAARVFADPLAYIFFIAGIVLVVGARGAGPGTRFQPAFFGALLLALGIFMKPVVAPAAAVLLGGAGLAALYFRQWPRLAGLCIGFLPVFSMALHNWVFGRAFVLFSSNSADSNLLVLPPSAWAAALGQLLHGEFAGLVRIVMQLADWLSGAAESYWTIPLNAAGVAVVAWVVLRGRRLDPWLRLIGAAALGQHAVAFFYNAASARYHFLTWFLTMLVAVVWFHDVAIAWFAQRYPAAAERIANHRAARQLGAALTRLQKVSA
ncbi:MAG: hypothetical protein ACK4UO_00325 [Pseudolabrys sp.]